MTDLGRPGAGYKLMVNCLVKITLGKFSFGVLIPPLINGDSRMELISLNVSQYFTLSL